MADRIAVGKQFMADLLARIPEEKRAAVAEALEGADEAVGFVGEGVLRQQDYSRSMNDLSAKHKELTDWYELNKAALDTAARGRTGDPAPTPTGLDLKAVEKLITEREQGVAAYIAYATDLSLKHFKEFGEPLDLTALLADPEATKLGIPAIYDRKFAKQYQEKREAAEKTRIDAAVEARVVEERKKFTSHPPYPTGDADLSPLDALAPTTGTDPNSVQGLTDEYNRLVGLRPVGA